MPKSWSFRASIATLTAGILVPAGPVHAVLLSDLAHRAGEDTLAARGLAGLVHLLLHVAGVLFHVGEPAGAVIQIAQRHLDAVGHQQREPWMVARRRRRVRDAQLRVALPGHVDLAAVARRPLDGLRVRLRALVARGIRFRRSPDR